MRIISWNTRHRPEIWRNVADLDADVALLQEASAPPTDIVDRLDVEPEPWQTGGGKRAWRTSVVGLRKDLRIERLRPRLLAEADRGDFGVSLLGTLAAAQVEHPSTAEPITLISMYSVWEDFHSSTEDDRIYSDASAHRLISDISCLVGRLRGHRIIATGDLNCLYGYGEHGSAYWATRYRTIFDRFAAIGLLFVGPQAPAGRQAVPWPKELPPDSLNVPTYYTARQTPASATRQLDFVFASSDLAGRVDVRALNQVDEWGPSDHCQIEITIRDS